MEEPKKEYDVKEILKCYHSHEEIRKKLEFKIFLIETIYRITVTTTFCLLMFLSMTFLNKMNWFFIGICMIPVIASSVTMDDFKKIAIMNTINEVEKILDAENEDNKERVKEPSLELSNKFNDKLYYQHQEVNDIEEEKVKQKIK